MSTQYDSFFRDEDFDEVKLTPEKVVCLGMEFESDDARRTYFREELRKKLPELRQIEGFPIGEDEDIINLSDPPYYTACHNPWLNDFVAQWEAEKVELEKQGKRKAKFEVKEPYASGIKEGKNNPIYNAHTYHTKVPHPAIMRYILHYTQPGDIIYDGFAGTGMAGVAASACSNVNLSIETEFRTSGYASPKWGKRYAVCGDLSPICFHISSNYNRKSNIKLLRTAITDLLSELEERFGHFYRFKEDSKRIGHINYYVWTEICSCKNCGAEINVHDLSFDYETHTLHKLLTCPYCGTQQQRIEANSIFETEYDNNKGEVLSVLKYRQCLLNYSLNGRYFSKRIDAVDFPEFVGYIPNEMFIDGDKVGDPRRVGCNRILQVYPKRTQYVLAYLYKRINEYEPSLQKSLMFIFTSMLPKLTRMNRYMPQHGSRALVGPMANTLYIPPQYVENNPIDQFEYQANKIVKALEVCHSGNAIQICSATNSSMPDNSVDYIFTDPPFGANIMYSELNQISEQWLRVVTNNREEAISNKSQHKGFTEYQNIMTQCLKEYYRILKPNRWMTVEFSNTSAAFWNSLQYAIQSAGFIITSVTDINKERGGLHAMISVTAVKQDLAITCYKPSERLQNINHDTIVSNVWLFVDEFLEHLPAYIIDASKLLIVPERDPRILYDRLISYYVQHGYAIPMDAQEFQRGLRERFIERDGMFFTASQAVEYEAKRATTSEFVPMALFISSEAEGIEWLKRELATPQTYQELQPKWMKDLVSTKKGDVLPELMAILEENFIKDDDGKWRKPDAEKAADLEIIRNKKLMKEFNLYLEMAQKPRAKRMKNTRLEVLRHGFKECYKQKDYQAILTVGNHIPESLLQEDEVLLQYYDIASMRV